MAVGSVPSPVLPGVTTKDHEDIFGGDNDSGLMHTVCECDPHKTLCGRIDLSDDILPAGQYPNDCIVCEDLANVPCPICDYD